MESLFKNKWIELVDDNGWFFVKRPNITGIVAIIAITEDNELLLVEQYRPAVGKNVIEIPAGLVGDINLSESLENAARRELLEETGYETGKMDLLIKLAISPGVSDEITHVYITYDVKKVSDKLGVDGEEIKLHKIKADDLYNFMEEIHNKEEKLFSATMAFAVSVFELNQI